MPLINPPSYSLVEVVAAVQNYTIFCFFFKYQNLLKFKLCILLIFDSLSNRLCADLIQCLLIAAAIKTTMQFALRLVFAMTIKNNLRDIHCKTVFSHTVNYTWHVTVSESQKIYSFTARIMIQTILFTIWHYS